MVTGVRGLGGHCTAQVVGGGLLNEALHGQSVSGGQEATGVAIRDTSKYQLTSSALLSITG